MIVKSRVKKRAPHTRKAKTNGMMCFFMLLYAPERNHRKKKIKPMSTVIKSNGPAHGYFSCFCSWSFISFAFSPVSIDAADGVIYDHLQ